MHLDPDEPSRRQSTPPVFPTRVARASADEGTPQPDQFASAAAAQRLPPPQIVLSASRRQQQQQQRPSERTELIPPPVSPTGAPKYRTNLREYVAEQTGRVTDRVGFWAAATGVVASTALVAYCVYGLVSAEARTADLTLAVPALALGVTALVVESFQLLAHWYPVWPHVRRPGRHILAHSFIWCLCILPFVRGAWLFGVLFLLHVIPASLYYIAKLRREYVEQLEADEEPEDIEEPY